jgi:hypothetical protein
MAKKLLRLKRNLKAAMQSVSFDSHFFLKLFITNCHFKIFYNLEPAAEDVSLKRKVEEDATEKGDAVDVPEKKAKTDEEVTPVAESEETAAEATA